MMTTKPDKTKADFAKVKKRYGNTTGASKGKAPVSAKPKIKPTGSLKKPGIKATWKF